MPAREKPSGIGHGLAAWRIRGQSLRLKPPVRSMQSLWLPHEQDAVGSFLGKVASLKDIPHRVYFFEGVGTLTVFTMFVIYNRGLIFNNFSFNAPALFMGLTWGIGTVLFIAALKYAKLSVTVPLTAVYPALTVILAFVFLGERLGPKEIAGVLMAIGSAALLAK